MMNRRVLSMTAAALLMGTATLKAAQSGFDQAQGALENASAAMDGMKVSKSLAVQGGEGSAKEGASSAAKAQPGAKLDKAAVPSPAASAPAPKHKRLLGFYKWCVRNPVEASAFVAIPATLIAGPMVGMIAGGVVYAFLATRAKKPF